MIVNEPSIAKLIANCACQDVVKISYNPLCPSPVNGPLCDSKISFIEETAESIALDSETFDCVIIGYTLCTIPEPLLALAEVNRLLKPSGSLFFMEHGLAPEESVQKWQHRIAPGWKKIAGGCNLNRNIEALILSGGFEFKDLKKK